MAPTEPTGAAEIRANYARMMAAEGEDFEFECVNFLNTSRKWSPEVARAAIESAELPVG